MGDNGGLRAILAERLCPETAYVVARPEHVPVVEEFYDWGRPGLMLRMALRGEDFRGENGGCVRLTTSNLGDLAAFYADGGVNSFSPEHMEHNVFYGVFEGGASRRGSRNAPGQPDLRRGGGREAYTRYAELPSGEAYGTATTSAVVGELVRQGIQDIVLTVGRENEGAIRVYERLGFRRHCPIVAGPANRLPRTSR